MKKTCIRLISLIMLFSLFNVMLVFAEDTPKNVLKSINSVVRVLASNDVTVSAGTGFVVSVDKENTYIVTNDHVTNGFDYVSIVLNSEADINCQVTAADSERDLCVLRVSYPLNMNALPILNGKPEKGESVFTIGYPAAADIFTNSMAMNSADSTLTDGIVSALRSAPIIAGGRSVDMVQFTAPINSGNSGGPALNKKGEVIGVCSYGTVEVSQGIFGAISSTELIDFLEENEIPYGNSKKMQPIKIAIYAVIGLIVIGSGIVILINAVRKKTKIEEDYYVWTEDESQKRKNAFVVVSEKIKALHIPWGKIAIGILCVAVLGAGVFYVIKYKQADKYATNHQFSKASECIVAREITKIHDSNLVSYISAGLSMGEKNYEYAKELFTILGEYKDSTDMAELCSYSIGVTLFNRGEYEKAKNILTSIKGYKDVDNIIKECDYQVAFALYNEGKYDEAEPILCNLKDSNYKNSGELWIHIQCKDIVKSNQPYNATVKLYAMLRAKDNKPYREIIQGYLNDLQEPLYKDAVKAYHAGKYSKAQEMFSQIREYRRAKDYLDLIVAHNSYVMVGKTVQNLIPFEDSGELIMKYHDNAWEFLQGKWETAGRTLYMKFSDSVEWNLPAPSDAAGWVNIEKGILRWSPTQQNPKYRDFFRITIIDKNTILVYCYKINDYYTMYRR